MASTPPLSLPPQPWLQCLMLEIVRHDAALTKAKEKVLSLTTAMRRHLHGYTAPPPCVGRHGESVGRWRATPATPTAERRKQFEVERLRLRQAQDHELFLLKQAQELEMLLHALERDQSAT